MNFACVCALRPWTFLCKRRERRMYVVYVCARLARRLARERSSELRFSITLRRVAVALSISSVWQLRPYFWKQNIRVRAKLLFRFTLDAQSQTQREAHQDATQHAHPALRDAR